jgi:hypothetical protein
MRPGVRTLTLFTRKYAPRYDYEQFVSVCHHKTGPNTPKNHTKTTNYPTKTIFQHPEFPINFITLTPLFALRQNGCKYPSKKQFSRIPCFSPHDSFGSAHRKTRFHQLPIPWICLHGHPHPTDPLIRSAGPRCRPVHVQAITTGCAIRPTGPGNQLSSEVAILWCLAWS